MLFNKISQRIIRLRKDFERAKEDNDFGKCLKLEGEIFYLEMILVDIASQPTTQADPK